MMAHEFEEGPDGLYSVCVFNAESCTDDEMYEIFGKFGDIVKMNRTSNIVFLRYQTLREATDCYESMANNTRFKVKPGKRKGSSNHTARFREEKVSDMSRNDNFRGRKPESSGSGDYGRPSAAGGNRRGPPRLIPFPPPAAKEEGACKPPPSAKIVVLGNLHPKMGQNNVYNLCSKAKAPPLHVAMKTLKRPPYPNISYAFVYVRNDEEVDNIVTSLNNLILNGYKLVVNDSEKLKEEGKVLLRAK